MLRQSEKVILAGLITSATQGPSDNALDELENLVISAGGAVAEKILQKRRTRDPAFLIGKGKALEIADIASRSGSHCVVFDEELSSTQQRNLENLLGTKVIDRTRLILDVFAKRAKTREGMLQVELAQHSYLLSRLTGRGREMSQQWGGIGTRGPGERALEYDRRRIRTRIQHIKNDLDRVRLEREVQRAKRLKEGVAQAAIVGYTNAGKSSLLNALVASKRSSSAGEPGPAWADERLFATLDTMTRRVYLPCGLPILLTDTVGFISKLPTHLVTSFRATLEEIRWADLLIHVSDPACPDEIRIHRNAEVNKILKSLEVNDYPQLQVFSKADLVPAGSNERLIPGASGLWVSCKTGEGLDKLLAAIEKRLLASWGRAEIKISAHQGHLLALVYKVSKVLNFRADGKGG
ncbi:MAG: GTPase HflX, partial [Elusimicrobiota bacterium]